VTGTSLFSCPQLLREIFDGSPSAQGSSLIVVFPPGSRQAWTRELAGERASGDERWQHAVGREGFLRVFPEPSMPSPKHMSPSIAVPVAGAGRTRGAHGVAGTDSSCAVISSKFSW